MSPAVISWNAKLWPGLTLGVIFLVLLSASVKGQTNDAITPAWVKMMDDSATNYYEAIRVYNEYWKNHVKPAGEEEEMKEGNKDSNEREREVKREIRHDRKRVVTEEDLKKQNENVFIKYQVKRFEQWTREVKPYVQEDGRILTPSERMEIWSRQQEEMKKLK